MAPTCALLKICQTNKSSVYPETYMKASGEVLVVLFCASWMVTALFNPKVIEHNPLKDRLGYNNVCVGFDTPPARYVGLVLFMPCFHLVMRYIWLDIERTALVAHRLTSGQYWFSMLTAAAYAVSVCIFPLVFVVDPSTSVWGHSMPFVQFMLFRNFAVWANIYESDAPPHSAWIFAGVSTFFTFAFTACVLLNFVAFDAFSGHPGFAPPLVPARVTAVLDYCWLACVGLTNWFLPDAEEIRLSYEIRPRRENSELEGGEGSGEGEDLSEESEVGTCRASIWACATRRSRRTG